MDGDPVTQTWSIGGPYPRGVLSTIGILGNPHRISYSHNKYEGDSWACRADADINNGDARKSFHPPSCHVIYLLYDHRLSYNV